MQSYNIILRYAIRCWADTYYPFAGKGKEKEFPDAFVLQTLEKYAADNQIKKVIVLSEDGDMTDYQSPVLDTSEDYKMYLSRKLKEDADLSGFEEALNDSLPNLERLINLKVGKPPIQRKVG